MVLLYYGILVPMGRAGTNLGASAYLPLLCGSKLEDKN